MARSNNKNGTGKSKKLVDLLGGGGAPSPGKGLAARIAPAAMLPLYPGIVWEANEIAQLQMRLDLFDDTIIATRYKNGSAIEASFIVDPLDLAQRLTSLDISTGLLPENCLFWQRKDGEDRIGVWLPPRIWDLRVEPTDKPNRKIPLPGFVFVGQGKSYSLYATAEATRPQAATQLYYPPTANVGGGVCQGNVVFPMAGPATIYRAVEAFFGSGFNSHLDNDKSKRYPKGILSMWKALHRAKAEQYPVDDLVEVPGLTLGKLITR